VRRRGRIALVWLVGAIVLLPAARRATATLGVSAAAVRGEGAEVDRMLRERFDSPYARNAVLVLTGVPTPDTAPGRALLDEALGSLDNIPFVRRTLSFPSSGDRSLIGSRSTFVLVGLADDGEGADSGIQVLRAATADVARGWRVRYPDASIAWTGSAALDFDVRALSSEDATAAEGRALPLTLVLLVLAFGSVGAALLPVAVGALAIALSLGTAALIAPHVPLTVLLGNIVSMLGLGVGIDYALLMVHRFREGLAAALSPAEAAAESVRHAGHAVMLSGVSVAVGFATLLIVPAVELRSVAIGGLLVITISVLLAVTLLPGVLAQAGRRIDLARVRRATTQANGEERWRRWGAWVAAHPVPVLLAAGLPVILLAWPARRMSTDLPSGDWLPPRMESARAAATLRAMNGSGIIQTVRLIVRLPDRSGPTTADGWQAVRRLADTLRRDPRAARVFSLPTLVAAELPDALLLSNLPAHVSGAYLSRDRRDALVEVVPRETESPAAMVRFVRELRARDPIELTGLAGSRVLVGGLPALNADYQDAIGHRAALVVALVIGGTLMALLIGFRSLLIPLKAVALNLLSVAAAFGAAVLVFQDGHGARLLGLTGPIDGFFPAVPIIVFCVVFGLSMDYEVFLVARMAECHRAGLDDAHVLAEGLACTGGVITSAAAIMIGVFACFALGDFLIIKILGFCLAVAVFLDATLVRVAIGPALFRLAGQWNWWPGERRGSS
jgi:RND superfamily putative drug exporter